MIGHSAHLSCLCHAPLISFCFSNTCYSSATSLSPLPHHFHLYKLSLLYLLQLTFLKLFPCSVASLRWILLRIMSDKRPLVWHYSKTFQNFITTINLAQCTLPNCSIYSTAKLLFSNQSFYFYMVPNIYQNQIIIVKCTRHQTWC